MERKERKDHARNKALVLIAISKGINAWKEIAQEIGKTQRATFDILKELERDEIIEGEREKSFNPHNTKKVRYRFKEQGVIGSILSSFKIWDLIWNVPEKREEFMRTERYSQIVDEISEIVFMFQLHEPKFFGYVIEINKGNGTSPNDLFRKAKSIFHEVYLQIETPYEELSLNEINGLIKGQKDGRISYRLFYNDKDENLPSIIEGHETSLAIKIIKEHYHQKKFEDIFKKCLYSSNDAMTYALGCVQALIKCSRVPERYKKRDYGIGYDDKYWFILESILKENEYFVSDDPDTVRISSQDALYIDREKHQKWIDRGFLGDVTATQFHYFETKDPHLFIAIDSDWLGKILLIAIAYLVDKEAKIIMPMRYLESYLLS